MTASGQTKDVESKAVNAPASYGVARLVVVCCVICFVWGIVLPKYSAQPRHQEYFRRIDAYGIDPMALFYTDHDLRYNRTERSVDQ